MRPGNRRVHEPGEVNRGCFECENMLRDGLAARRGTTTSAGPIRRLSMTETKTHDGKD